MNISRRLFRIATAAFHKGKDEFEKKIGDGRSFIDKELSEWEQKLGVGDKKRPKGQAKPKRPASPLEEDLGLFRLKPGAPWEDVKKAYRREAKKYHADRHNHNDEKRKTAHEIMLIYNEAFDRLKKVYGKK